ncbi:XdhC family protein [Rhodococcus sp. ACPA1]|uniref:XdhC family protein n=1 Tax=Rhodococcus sp. ACPA1 TaxID=2028572 RepID=UPI000BB11D50|nr:XdhC/CoxI family protein [Rhodococcus sp. ACPA1]PBC56242.1 XshC-Cox1 family protein [Rhodococcus sp. ACPA1]
MRDILAGLTAWYDRDVPFALATIVRTWKSSPRAPGAAMAVSQSGEVIGSVSGGCVEGALYETALEVLADGRSRTDVFRVTDDDAFGVGLTCGGTIEVFVQRVDRTSFPQFVELADRIREGNPVAVVTDTSAEYPTRHCVLSRHEQFGDLSIARDDVADVKRGLDSGDSAVYVVEVPGRANSTRTLMVEVFVPLPRMYIFGAIDFAAALCRLGAFAGYHVTVIDARPVFATPARFPDADDIVVMWPHKFLESAPIDRRTVIAVLTHDEKFDLPLLERALRSHAAYIGAMGSRPTHERRVKALRERGLSTADLARLHSPIGLDLGAQTPEETAVSILAEMMKTIRGSTGGELRLLSGPIHRPSIAVGAGPREHTVCTLPGGPDEPIECNLQ